MAKKSRDAEKLKSQIDEIRHYLKAKQSFVSEEMWNKKISKTPDYALTDKVNAAIVEFCRQGYMDTETFEQMKPMIHNPDLLELMKRSIRDGV